MCLERRKSGAGESPEKGCERRVGWMELGGWEEETEGRRDDGS